jgi:hypothetical protein
LPGDLPGNSFYCGLRDLLHGLHRSPVAPPAPWVQAWWRSLWQPACLRVLEPRLEHM